MCTKDDGTRKRLNDRKPRERVDVISNGRTCHASSLEAKWMFYILCTLTMVVGVSKRSRYPSVTSVP